MDDDEHVGRFFEDYEGEEEEEKRRILAYHEFLRAHLLEHIRGELRSLYVRRVRVSGPAAFCSSDDSREILEALNDLPPPSEMSRSFLGKVFLDSEWWSDGTFVKSKQKGNHARLHRKWRRRGFYEHNSRDRAVLEGTVALR